MVCKGCHNASMKACTTNIYLHCTGISEHYIWLPLLVTHCRELSATGECVQWRRRAIARLHKLACIHTPSPPLILFRPIAVKLYGSDQPPHCHSSWWSSPAPSAWEASSPRPSTAEMHSPLSPPDKRLHKSTLAGYMQTAHDQAASHDQAAYDQAACGW